MDEDAEGKIAISLEDVKTAWTGVTIKIPYVPPPPAKQEYLTFYFGAIICIFLGILFSVFEQWGVAALFLVAVILLSIKVFLERKKYLIEQAGREKALEARNQALEAQMKAIEKLRRGYQYLGENYQDWLDEGLRRLRGQILQHLELPELDISAEDVNWEVEIPSEAPVSPEIDEESGNKYPLPGKVGCTFYFLTPRKLIVVPAGAVNAASRAGREGTDAGVRFVRPYVPIDVEAMSYAPLESEEKATALPDISSRSVFLADVNKLEYYKPMGEHTGFIHFSVEDGEDIEVLGGPILYELLRSKIKK